MAIEFAHRSILCLAGTLHYAFLSNHRETGSYFDFFFLTRLIKNNCRQFYMSLRRTRSRAC